MEQGQSGTKPDMEIATLGGGCFWCLQPIFQDLRGVERVEVGYSGGNVPNPSYEEVCTGSTGHAEVVQLTFDPEVISFDEILEVFFAVHDPTTLNRQGPDVGTQYRSAIFYRTADQKATAGRVMSRLEKANAWKHPIVTEVSPFADFFLAEDYHQDYFTRNPNQSYCRVIVRPKVDKFRKQFRSRLKE